MYRLGYIVLLLSLLTPGISQYWGERATEKSFEESQLYFKSYYLNTFGIGRFGDVAAGLIDDPFLNLYLNPAHLPKLENGNLVYLDFRGDRTEPEVMGDYVVYGETRWAGMAPDYIYDPRWYSTTRREPEPIFSLGYLAYPFQESSRKFLVGATYQLIYKQESFYSPPSWIYWGRYGYDAFGVRVAETNNVPIQDRYVGENKMLNTGHLFSAFLGSQVSEKISAGLSLDGIIHQRDGSYVDRHSDEYGQTNDYDWQYSNEMSRDQDYRHYDIAGGLNYQISPVLRSGIKLGYLNGNAEQDYNTQNLSFYQYNIMNVSPEWSYHRSEGSTDQYWKQDGKNWYGSVNLSRQTQSNNVINFYYRYTQSDIDVSNRSAILDTAFYSSRWLWDSTYYDYRNSYSMQDTRQGQGKRESTLHEVMLNSQIKLTEKNNISVGIYYSHKNSDIHSSEPVIAERSSNYFSTGYYYYNGNNYLYEDKTLEWQYHSREWSLQIPLVFDFKLNEHWLLSVGLNKILKSWEITDETIAYFRTRQRMENDTLKTENNFGERYREPDRILSEEYTDLIGRVAVNISPRFQINLLVDPAFDDSFRISHWWLGFRASL